jgi:AraC family transcriptional regulator
MGDQGQAGRLTLERAEAELDSDRAIRLAKLVVDAERAIETDVEAARIFLQQAVALLGAQVERLAQDEPHARLAPWQVKRAMRFIDENAGRRFQVSEIASAVRLSPGYFSHAFKETFGRAAKAYIIDARLQRAKHMMIETSATLAQIGEACGFADAAHFSRTFNTWVGESPSRWRQSVLLPVAALAAEVELDALAARLRPTAPPPKAGD